MTDILQPASRRLARALRTVAQRDERHITPRALAEHDDSPWLNTRRRMSTQAQLCDEEGMMGYHFEDPTKTTPDLVEYWPSSFTE